MATAVNHYAYDLAVIGGGPGGYTAAICAARRGLRTVLIERDALGGTCLNRGCIPTKSYFYDTKRFRLALDTEVIRGKEKLQLNAAALVARKRKVVDSLVGGVQTLVRSNGAKLIKGEAELVSANHIRVSLPNGGCEELNVKHVLLANGSRPAIPPFIKIDGRVVQTTDQLLEDPSFAGKVLIIGGGVIGIEMAGIFLNAGAEVTIVEMLPDILVTEDRDVRREMKRQLKKHGADLRLQTSVKEIAVHEAQARVAFQAQANERSEVLTVDRVLVATGRAPVLDGIDTGKLGLAIEGPFLKVNARLETSLPGVFAVGDVIGGMMLAHKASAEAEAVVDNILGGNQRVDPRLIPRCIWGLLEIGAVGMNEEEAAASSHEIKIGKFPFEASGAARAMGRTDGFVKVVGDATSGEILGVHIIGEHATELIGEASTAMTMEGAVEDLSEAVRPHPTLSEAVMEAALHWNGVAIHMPRKSKR